MGYDFDRFVSPVNEGLLCGICRDVLEDPLQGPCEHAFCSSCIYGWLVYQNICPEDRRPLYASQLRPLFRYMRKDLDALQIRCRGWAAGCRVVCSLENLCRHEEACEFQTVCCPSTGCTVTLSRRDIEDHLATCEFRTKQCPRGCGLPILNRDDHSHNCIAELRTALEVLRSEMICKTAEQTREFDLRFDAQRRQMVENENSLRSQVDALTVQVSQLLQEVQGLKENERRRQDDVGCTHAERERSDVIRSLSDESQTEGEKLLCPNCWRRERIGAL